MLQRFGIARDLDVDHQAQRRQVDAPGGDVGCHTNPRPAVAQRLQSIIALALAVLTRERDGGKPAFDQRGVQVPDIVAGCAEQHRSFGLVEAQQVDHRMLDLGRSDCDRLIGNIAVTAILADSRDPQRIALVPPGERDDRLGHGRRKQQRAAGRRHRVEDFLEVFAEAHVEHLIRLVEHDGAHFGEVERAAFKVIAQPPRRADHDVRAMVQRAAFLAGVHAPDAADDPGAGLGIEPGQLAADLQGEFAGRRDHQRKWSRSLRQLVFGQQFVSDGEAESDGLARSGLRRNHQIAATRARLKHLGLDRGQRGIAMRGERFGEKRGYIGKGHDALPPRGCGSVWLALICTGPDSGLLPGRNSKGPKRCMRPGPLPLSNRCADQKLLRTVIPILRGLPIL